MKRTYAKLAAIALMSAGLMGLASCSSEPKEQTAAAPRSDSEVRTYSGVAGGVTEDVYIVEALVESVDVASRRVTLKGSEGDLYTFTARPEIKNLPQLKVGDKVTATFARRMVVTVKSQEMTPSETKTSVAETATIGQKPGMLVAEETEKVARITGIDTVNRVADLQFADGILKKVPVRSDVDLSKYKVGDSVVIRVTTALTVIVESRTP